MRRAERLFRLVDEMRTRGVVRAADLAEVFEVSATTIYRDIAHLQASGLPIDGEPGIGYMLRNGFDLPNLTFTHDQLDALAVGLTYVESSGDPVLAAAAREVRAKLQAGLPEPEERRLADAPYRSLHPQHANSDLVPDVRIAIRDRKVVAFAYRDKTGAPSERRVRPILLWNMPDGWMFTGWCELRDDFRSFRFDRVSSFAVTDARFEDTPREGLTAFMELERAYARCR